MAHLDSCTLETCETIPADQLARVSGGFSGGTSLVNVKSGDNLSAIAQSNGVSLSDVEKWNPQFSSNFDLIHPGDKVIINRPVTGTTQGPTVHQDGHNADYQY